MDPRWHDYREAAARAVGLLAMLDEPLSERLEDAKEEVSCLDGSALPPDLALAWRAVLAHRTGPLKPRRGRSSGVPDPAALETAGRLLSLWRDLVLLTQEPK